MGGDNSQKVEAGLPNITSTFFRVLVAPSGEGPIGAIAGEQYNTIGSQGSAPLYNVDLNASRSNAIYGNADTVQPPALSLIPQIKY